MPTPGDAARKRQVRRSPVHGLLIVAGDARHAGDVRAIREVRCGVVGLSQKLVADPQDELVVPVRPVERRVEIRRRDRIDQSEDGRRLVGGALIRRGEQERIPIRQAVIQARLEGVEIGGRPGRSRVVVRTATVDVRLWIQGEERRCLRADARAGNHVARKSHARVRIANLAQAREISRAHPVRRHDGRLGKTVVIGVVLIAGKEHRPVSHAWNPERPAERRRELRVGVIGLRHGRTGKRKRPRVQRRRPERQPEAAGVEGTLARTVVAKAARLRERRRRRVVHTAVDQQSLGRLSLELGIDRIGCDGGVGCDRCVGCVRCDRLADRRDFLDFLERQKRELAGEGAGVVTNRDLARDGLEAEHLDANAVASVCETGQLVSAVGIGRHDDGCVALSGRDRRAREPEGR